VSDTQSDRVNVATNLCRQMWVDVAKCRWQIASLRRRECSDRFRVRARHRYLQTSHLALRLRAPL